MMNESARSSRLITQAPDNAPDRLKVGFVPLMLVIASFWLPSLANHVLAQPVANGHVYRTLWLPLDGQEHPTGVRSGSSNPNYITTWAAENKKGILSKASTTVPAGTYVAAAQIYWKVGEGDELGQMLVTDATGISIASTVIRAEPFSDSGEYQRVAVEFRVTKSTEVTISIDYYNIHYIWVGAMSLNPKGRPYYNMAHRRNAVAGVDDAVAQGANGIEFDIHPVGSDSGITGFICYHFGDQDSMATETGKFGAFLDNIKRHLDDKKLALVMFDCKSTFCDGPGTFPSGESNIDVYAKALVAAIKKSGIPSDRIVLSIPQDRAEDMRAAVVAAGLNCSIDSYLESYPSVDNSEDLVGIAKWVKSVKATGANFVGVGKDSKVRGHFYHWAYWLAGLVKERDQGDTINKVWFWTANTKYAVRQCLDFSVDGVLTDYPADGIAVLAEEPYRNIFRLATQNDPLTTAFGR